jgi:hypothetical protein
MMRRVSMVIGRKRKRKENSSLERVLIRQYENIFVDFVFPLPRKIIRKYANRPKPFLFCLRRPSWELFLLKRRGDFGVFATQETVRVWVRCTSDR